MLLGIIFLWPLSVVIAYYAGQIIGSKKKDNIRVIHTVPDDIHAIRIIHLDEYEGSVEEVKYKKDPRWLSGFKKVVIKS